MNFNNHHHMNHNTRTEPQEADDSMSVRSGISEETFPLRPESVALSNFYVPPKSRMDDEYLDIADLRASFYESTLKSAKTQNGLLISELPIVRGTPAFTLVGTNFLWVGSISISVYDTDTLKEERKLTRGDPPIQVRSLLALDNGEVWSGYCDGAITVWNSTTYQLVVQTIQTQSTGVLSLAVGRPGEVWVGCEDWKIRVFNAHTKVQIRVLEGVCRDWVRCILSVDNRMWMGTDKGMFIYDKNEGTLISEDPTKQSALCMTVVGVAALPTYGEAASPNDSVYSGYHATPPPALHPHPPSSSSSSNHNINNNNNNYHSNNIPTTPPSSSPEPFRASPKSHSQHGPLFPQVWVGGSSDGNINIHAATPNQGILTQTISAHSKEVTCLLNVGNHIWSGSQDGTIKLWDKKNYSLIQTIDVYFPVRSLILVGNEVWVGGFKKLQVRLATSLLEWSDFELRSQIINKSNNQENYSKVVHEKLLLEEEQSHMRHTISNLQSEVNNYRDQLHRLILEKESLEVKVADLNGKSLMASNRYDEAIAEAQKSDRLLEVKLKEEVETKKEITGMRALLTEYSKKEDEMAKKIAEFESLVSSLERQLDEEKDRSNKARVLEEELSRKTQIEISLQLEFESLKQQSTLQQKVHQEKMEAFREEKQKIEEELRTEKTALENKVRELEAAIAEEREASIKIQSKSNSSSPSSSSSTDINLHHKIKELEHKLNESENSRDTLAKKLSNLRTNTPRSPKSHNHQSNHTNNQNIAHNTKTPFLMGFILSTILFSIGFFVYFMTEKEENEYPFLNWELYTGPRPI
eukprot:TRINITY_DN1512_c0_g1_i1.p1 TRINITY_DN1512_c0_g1~~TRINITY_DN1512_c0_g1_i1.p1  ORF type:complete len:807 (+),score=186.02 TRINITY_DN1512_c0_g1_i1:144-2564(+)